MKEKKTLAELKVGDEILADVGCGTLPLIVDEITPGGDVWALDKDGKDYMFVCPDSFDMAQSGVV